MEGLVLDAAVRNWVSVAGALLCWVVGQLLGSTTMRM
jgi:hypothetical protein